MELNKNRLYWTALGAIAVMAGVVTKNSNKQREESDDSVDKAGGLAFLAGWAVVAYAMGLDKDGKHGGWEDIASWAPAAAIVASVYMMKKDSAEGNPVNKALPMAFVAAWMYIGHHVATRRKLSGYARTAAYAAPAMVVASMLFAFPEQRKICMVDGPGAYLFNTAWATLAVTNAM